MKTVNFGIDLGTTNSLISKYDNGVLDVFKNPLGHKQTLSSAVAFRKNRVLVGDKARELLERDSLNVFTCFKRKMGTSEEYYVPNLEKNITPIELSSYVLQELKNFVHTGEKIYEVVITIPSSFDTIQSNATKIAGEKSGFKKVYLLQEPIAASLAYANKNNLKIEDSKKWLVYDFGGGTFDVALVEVSHREMNVLDNEGDNFLGGVDIDNLIIEKLIVPFLEEKLQQENLWQEFKEEGSIYQKLYYELLFKAEEAKKELSIFDTVEIEIDYEEGDVYESITISRESFNSLIEPLVERTIDFSKKVLTNNNLIGTDIEKIVLVGGTTLIPYVRERLADSLQVIIDTSVDPTAAVGIGAGYYAGSKLAMVEEVEETHKSSEKTIQTVFEVFYSKDSKDLEELINIKNYSKKEGYYRLIRLDGGFDTGLVKLEDDIHVFVDLLEGVVNVFDLKVFDDSQQEIYSDKNIKIHQGKYSIKGQLLPQDICLEVDDVENYETRLEAIFTKNSILPLKKTLYKTASKTIIKNSEDLLQINIVEGDDNGLPSSGLTIGYIEISGRQLNEDLIKGTDIELEITMSESRDVMINVFLSSSEQEFENKFTPTKRYISKVKIEKDLNMAISNLDRELQNHGEDYELLTKFRDIRNELIELQITLTHLSEKDTTDKKFSIDNQKRELIKKYDALTRHSILDAEINEYKEIVMMLKEEVKEEEMTHFKSQLDTITKNEKDYINSGNKYLIKSKIKELQALKNTIFNSDDRNFIMPYIYYKTEIDKMSDQVKAETLIREGDKALENKDYKVLKYVVYQLSSLMPEDEDDDKKKMTNKDKTGLQ